MNEEEFVTYVEALYIGMLQHSEVPRDFTRSDIAEAFLDIAKERSIYPEDMTKERASSEEFISEIRSRAFTHCRKRFNKMPDYPTNAQSAWRWTMSLIDNIGRHPELLDTSDLGPAFKEGLIKHALMVQDFMKIIQSAKFIFWNTEIFNTALNGAESFIGERFQASDFWSPTYYTYDKVQTSANRENECNFGMLMLPLDHDECDLIIPIGLNGVISKRDKDGTAVIDRFALEMMGHVQANQLIDGDNIIGQQLSAAAAFLKMKVAAKERALLPRPERRRMKREGKKEPELYTVSLRKTQGKAENAGTGELVERDSHWMVSAHWRRQWFPSVEKHAPLWIDGYIKGDTTKPFKASKKRVFAAVR